MFSVGFTANAVGKIKFASMKQAVYHSCRDLEHDKNKRITLKSETIHPEFTKYNRTYIYTNAINGKKGFLRTSNVNDIFTEIDRRFEGVQGRPKKDGGYRAVRSDAVAMREIVIQLGNHDNSYYKNMSMDDLAHDQSYIDLMHWAQKKFGDHIVYASIHLDEGGMSDGWYDHHPHLHIGLDCLYKDEYGIKHINQKTLGILSSPKELKQAHEDLYAYMKHLGYDVGVPTEKIAKTRQRLSQKEYNKLRDAQTKSKNLEKQAQDVAIEKQAAADYWKGVRSYEQDTIQARKDAQAYLSKQAIELNDRESDLDSREVKLKEREDRLDDLADLWEMKYRTAKKKLDDSQKKAEQAREQARKAESLARQKVADANRTMTDQMTALKQQRTYTGTYALGFKDGMRGLFEGLQKYYSNRPQVKAFLDWMRQNSEFYFGRLSGTDELNAYHSYDPNHVKTIEKQKRDLNNNGIDDSLENWNPVNLPDSINLPESDKPHDDGLSF